MHSNANPNREDANGGKKEWPLQRWEQLSQHLQATRGCDVLAIGSEFDPQVRSPFWRNLYGLPIKVAAALLQEAACVVTLENGIGHLAHGVNAPLVMIYSDIVPLQWANPAEATRRQVLYGDPHKATADEVIAAVESLMQGSKPHPSCPEAL